MGTYKTQYWKRHCIGEHGLSLAGSDSELHGGWSHRARQMEMMVSWTITLWWIKQL